MSNKIDNCPNVEERCEKTHLPDEIATLNKDLQKLSGEELCAFLERWKTLLLGDNSYTSLIFPVFSKVSRKVNGITPMQDNLSFLEFLAQLKQTLFSCDIFVYGEELYNEYLEGVYRLAVNCSYYLKPALLQKYASDEIEKYEEIRKVFEEHYNGNITEWLETDRNERVGYLPSFHEIYYLTEQAQIFIREDGNIDKALFFLYRAVLLSLKCLMDSETAKSMEEKEKLFYTLLDMVTAYQLASDEIHALEVLEYAQNVVIPELMMRDFMGQNLDMEENNRKESNIEECKKEESNRKEREIEERNIEESTIEERDIEEYTSDIYGDLRQKILRKKGHVQKELYWKKKGVTKEDVLFAYQEALSFSEAIFGTDSSQAEEVRQDIAQFRASEGEQSEVFALLEQLKTAEEEMDTDKMESLCGLISEIYEGLGDFDNAIAYYKKSVDIITDEYGEESDMAADYYNMMGELYEKAGRFLEASDYYKRALSNYQAYLLRTQEEDADDPENILANYEECLFHTGRMYLVMGKYEEAISHLEEALDIYDSRCRYKGSERADYLKVMAETYEKMQFMGKACYYYLWAWDGYQTVAEFNRLRERNSALFEEETEACVEKEEQVRLHMQKIGMDRMLLPIEEIDYTALNTEEREYFLKQFGQLVRRRLKEEDIWKNWAFQWRVYKRIWKEWQQRTELDTSPVLEEAFSVLEQYLKKELDEKEFVEFSENFFDYLAGEEYEGDWEEEWEEEYMGFYHALEDFFHAILEEDTDFRSFQELICEQLPVWAEMFASVYYKDEDYTKYEKKLRYKQVVSSSVFVRWIAEIQADIRLVLSCQFAEELLGD